MHPVFPDAAAERLSWPGATGLAEDVRRYGKWMRDEAEKRIGHLYPKVKISGVDATVIAWIWARTVTCPNPACAGTMPLATNSGSERRRARSATSSPIPDGKRVRFEIAGPDGVPHEGTVGRTGAECLICGTPVPLSYIRAEGMSGRMGSQLMAIAAEGKRQRLLPCADRRAGNSGRVPRPIEIPDSDLPYNPRYLVPSMLRHAHLGRSLHQSSTNRPELPSAILSTKSVLKSPLKA